MHPNSPILASCPPRPARDCGRPAQAATRTHQPPSGNSQKTAKPASPRFAGHTPQPMPSCFPHASDPHTGHILIQPQSDHAPAETSGRLTRIHASSQLTQIPCADEGGMGVSVRHRFRDASASATTPRRRRRQRGQHLCSPAIGPEGPMDSPPEGGHVWHAWGVQLWPT